MDSIDEVKASLEPGQFIEIRYEDFVKDPTRYSDDIFANLNMPPHTDMMAKEVERLGIKDRGSRWDRDLTPQQITALTASLKDHLERRGYPI